MPPAHDRTWPSITLEQGAVQIAEMVIAEVANGEPEVLLGKGAEDLRRRPLVLGVFETEQDATAPRPILRMTEHETDGDTLAFKADGGEIVDGCFVKRRDCLTGWLS
jgi:hypothetical protein